MAKSEKMGPNQTAAALNALTANLDWSAFTVEEGQIIIEKAQELGKALMPHLREFLEEVAKAAVPVYRLEPLPMDLDGKSVTINEALSTVIERENGFMCVRDLWRKNESLIPAELKNSGDTVVFPETWVIAAGEARIEGVYWNGFNWVWPTYRVKDMTNCSADAKFLIPVPTKKQPHRFPNLRKW